MGNAVVNKVLDFFRGDNAEEEEEELDNEYTYEYDGEEQEEEDKGFFGRKNRDKVVNMPQTQVRMKICKPTSFEQSEEICNELKEKKSIIVNLEYVNKDVARRIVDFISGSVHALDGHIEKISNSIFLVAPFNYEIVNDLAREEIKNKLSVSWIRNNSNN